MNAANPAEFISRSTLMKYFKTKWIHNFEEEPVWIFSEIDEARWEHRKVHYFRNGIYEYADSSGGTPQTGLSITQLPELSEIGEDPQFLPSEITKEEFEAVWVRATGAK